MYSMYVRLDSLRRAFYDGLILRTHGQCSCSLMLNVTPGHKSTQIHQMSPTYSRQEIDHKSTKQRHGKSNAEIRLL